jgi:hypothetical protein
LYAGNIIFTTTTLHLLHCLTLELVECFAILTDITIFLPKIVYTFMMKPLKAALAQDHIFTISFVEATTVTYRFVGWTEDVREASPS